MAEVKLTIVAVDNTDNAKIQKYLNLSSTFTSNYVYTLPFTKDNKKTYFVQVHAKQYYEAVLLSLIKKKLPDKKVAKFLAAAEYQLKEKFLAKLVSLSTTKGTITFDVSLPTKIPAKLKPPTLGVRPPVRQHGKPSIPPDKIGIAAIGSSTVASSVFPAVLNRSFKSRGGIVHNYGKNGDTTAGMLSRFKQQILPRNDYSVLILYGGIPNNIGKNHITFQRFNAPIRKIVQLARRKGMKVLVVTSQPWGQWVENGLRRGKRKYSDAFIQSRVRRADTLTKKINKWIKVTFTGKSGVSVLDIYPKVQDPNKPGYLRSSLTVDGLHFHFGGYKLLGKAIARSMIRYGLLKKPIKSKQKISH